jgi:hypothetical protein
MGTAVDPADEPPPPGTRSGEGAGSVLPFLADTLRAKLPASDSSDPSGATLRSYVPAEVQARIDVIDAAIRAALERIILHSEKPVQDAETVGELARERHDVAALAAERRWLLALDEGDWLHFGQ